MKTEATYPGEIEPTTVKELSAEEREAEINRLSNETV